MYAIPRIFVMGATYKGFQMWYCDPDTLENLQRGPRFELCIVKVSDWLASKTQSSTTIDQVITDWESKGVDHRDISGLFLSSYYDGSEVIQYSNMLALCPIAINNVLNTTGRACKVKLVAANGYYAVSTQSINNNRWSFGSGSAESFRLYNKDGIYYATESLTAYGNGRVVFLMIKDSNFDGVLQVGMKHRWCSVSASDSENNPHYGVALETGSGVSASAEWCAWFNSITPFIPPSNDPYAPTDERSSKPGGGHGNLDGTGDNINVPNLPTLSAVDTGLITLFNPSLGELRSLASYLWSSSFDLETFKKMFADPIDSLLGLSIVPVAVPNGGSSNLVIGNITTSVSMNKAASQYVEVNCGSITVNEYWGAYLDYDPYTKSEIYLPYIGTHAISTDDIMGKTVEVVYHVDILSGACTAFIKCDNSVIYEFIGQCSSSIPITGKDWTNVINGVISAASAIGTMVATGGATAPSALGTIASAATNVLKPNVEKSGSMSGTGGMLGVQTPYLIVTRPLQAIPYRQNEYMGYPSFITVDIAELSGYTEFEHIHLENVIATDDEIQEIEQLLKTGVFF